MQSKMWDENGSANGDRGDADLSNTIKQLQSAYRDVMGTSTLRPDISDSKLTPGQFSLTKSLPQERPDTSWFTRPVHRTLQSDIRASSADLHQRTAPINATMEQLAVQYFPVTLGTINAISESTKDTAERQSMITSLGKNKASTLPGSFSQRPDSTRTKSKLSNSVTIGHTTANFGLTIPRTVEITSPYEHDLSRLRLERLKIEEDRLLELKRQEELERIRGPLPKWYELKTPRFNYEARKHHDLMKSRDQWQELLDYRKELTNTRPFYV